MSKIGKVIRELRQSKNMTLADLSENIVSRTFLSKFERGENDITLEKLFKLMERLNISLYELSTIWAQQYNNSHSTFIKALSNAIKNDNIPLLHDLIEKENMSYMTTNNTRHLHNQVILNQKINMLTDLPYNKSEVKKVVDYLLSVEDWHYYEITLLTNIMFCLDIEQIICITKMLLRKTNKHKYSNDYKKEVITCLSNAILFMIENHCLNDAKQALKEVRQFAGDSPLYYQLNKLKFYEGLIYIRSQQVEIGLKLANEAIAVMNFLENYPNAIAHQKYLDEFVANTP